MKPTSAETVVSAKPALVIFSKKNKLTNGPTSFLLHFCTKAVKTLITY